MKDIILERVAKIFEVKSLITFGITGTVIYLAAVKGTIEPKDVMLLAGMVFTYFFNKDKKTE
jgi:hypothetical protein